MGSQYSCRAELSQQPRLVTGTHLYVKKCVVVVAPVSPHPVLAVTAGPVDVLAVGQLPGLQVVLHTLLDPGDDWMTVGIQLTDKIT